MENGTKERKKLRMILVKIYLVKMERLFPNYHSYITGKTRCAVPAT
jgi:hypothetical protein